MYESLAPTGTPPRINPEWPGGNCFQTNDDEQGPTQLKANPGSSGMPVILVRRILRIPWGARKTRH